MLRIRWHLRSVLGHRDLFACLVVLYALARGCNDSNGVLATTTPRRVQRHRKRRRRVQLSRRAGVVQLCTLHPVLSPRMHNVGQRESAMLRHMRDLVDGLMD